MLIANRNLPLCSLLVLFALAGCGGGNTEKSFIPPVASARDGLTAALKAWQDGSAKPGRIDGTVPLQVIEPLWSAGKKLQTFEIVKEESTPDSPSKFTVKLTLEGATEPRDMVYVVVGKDPLWIMPEAEYQRNAGM